MEGTKRRNLDEALRLFAAQGYKATSVAELEAAAGLAPGSGGLYKHFASKREVLAAAIADNLEHLRAVQASLPGGPTIGARGDDDEDLVAQARLALAELDRSRDLSLLILREGAALTDVDPDVHDAWIHGTYATGAALLRAEAEAAGAPVDGVDFEAHAFLGLAPLVLHRLITWLTGTPPAGIDDDRLVAAWVRVFSTVRRSLTEE
jgi:AcrR family transcriptional regulator